MDGADYEELKSRLAEQAMTHDPLCPKATDELREYCECDLIARVREDERGKTLDDAWKWWGPGSYKQALLDALEAVKALPLRQSGLVMCVHQQSAVAAIEALGGER